MANEPGPHTPPEPPPLPCQKCSTPGVPVPCTRSEFSTADLRDQLWHPIGDVGQQFTCPLCKATYRLVSGMNFMDDFWLQANAAVKQGYVATLKLELSSGPGMKQTAMQVDLSPPPGTPRPSRLVVPGASLARKP